MTAPHYVLKVDGEDKAVRFKSRNGLNECLEVAESYLKSGTLLQIFFYADSYESNQGIIKKVEVAELVWQSTPTKFENESYWEGLLNYEEKR